MANKALAPINVRTLQQATELPRDNIDLGKEFWVCFDFERKTVTICQQKPGESATAKVTMPRRLFDQLARWYTTGSKR